MEHHRLVGSLLSQRRCLPKLCQEVVSEGKFVDGQFALDLGQPGGFLGVPDAISIHLALFLKLSSVEICGYYLVLLTGPGEGDGTPLHYSCLESPMYGGAWWAAVHGVAKSRT